MSDELTHHDDELLSAYVDGELSDEERARVEQRLTHDPAAQLFVEELRGMSAAIRSLPRPTASADLRADVWGAIDRAESGATVVERASSHEPAGLAGAKRPITWGLLAVAASMLAMFFVRGQREQNEGEVAVKAGPPPLASSAPAGGQPSAAPKDKARGAAAVVHDGPGAADYAAGVSRAQPQPPAATSPAPATASDGLPAAPAASMVDGGSDGLETTAGISFAALQCPTLQVKLNRRDASARFEQLLFANNIQVEATSNFAEAKAKTLSDAPAEASATRGIKSREQLALESSSSAKSDAASAEAPAAPSPDSVDDQVAAVLVEATPSQIANLVFACQSDAANFRYVVEAPTAGEVDSFAEGSGNQPTDRGLAKQASAKESEKRELDDESAVASESGASNRKDDVKQLDLAQKKLQNADYFRGGRGGGDGFVRQQIAEQASGSLSAANNAAAPQGRAMRFSLPRGVVENRDARQLNATVQQYAYYQQNNAAASGGGGIAGSVSPSLGERDKLAAATGAARARGENGPLDAAKLAEAAADAVTEPPVQVLFLLDAEGTGDPEPELKKAAQ